MTIVQRISEYFKKAALEHQKKWLEEEARRAAAKTAEQEARRAEAAEQVERDRINMLRQKHQGIIFSKIMPHIPPANTTPSIQSLLTLQAANRAAVLIQQGVHLQPGGVERVVRDCIQVQISLLQRAYD